MGLGIQVKDAILPRLKIHSIAHDHIKKIEWVMSIEYFVKRRCKVNVFGLGSETVCVSF